MALSNRCAAQPAGTGNTQTGNTQPTTMAPGALEGTQVGSLSGTAVRAAFSNASSVPRQQIVDLLDQAATLLPSGVYPQITPEGGRASREQTENHPSGWAADFQLVRNGAVLTPSAEPGLYTTVIASLVGNSLINNRVCGVGLYSWGVHIDQTESRQTGRGGVVSWNGWPRGSNAGPQSVLDNGISQGRARASAGQFAGAGSTPSDGSSGEPISPEAFNQTTAASADGSTLPTDQANAEAAAQAQTACDSQAPFNRNRGGCGPISGLAVAATLSIVQNEGLQIPPALAEATQAFESIPAVALNGDIVDLLRDPANALNIAGIADIANVTEQLLNTGVGNTLNALTGKMTASVAGIIDGGLNNLISRPINEIANNILGNGDLSKFTNIFNNVQGAIGAAGGLAQSLGQLQGQVFGNAREIMGSLGTNLFESVAGIDIDNIAGGLFQDLVGPIENVLGKIVEDTPLAMFGTAYRDMNAMVTQGLGSITSNLPALGSDLSSLGRLANFEDLLRIGTPGQVLEQLAVNGAAATQRVIAPALVARGLSVATINAPEFDDVAREILASVDKPDLIADAFQSLNIQRTANVSNLAEVVNPEWMFPTSKADNRFENLNDISLHLSILGNSNITDAQQMGELMKSMETIATNSAILNEIQPIKIEETSALKEEAVPTSEYSGDDDLTIADFIGTAAGYRVTNTLPKIKQYMDELTAEGVLDCYLELLQLMKDTLTGNYDYDGIDPPTPAVAGTYLTENDFITPLSFCGRYTFGFYAVKDDALLAIKAAVEEEMDYIYDNATGETLEKLKRLQALHDENNHQIYKEQKLRKKYGIDIGFSKTGVELFSGTGSKTEFKITGNPDTENDPNITVYVAGIKLTSGQFTYNAVTKLVTVSSAPAAGESVEIIYDTGNFPVTGNIRDVWSFTSSLEGFGTKTGFGKEADFIQRIVKDDVHGTRIKAAMIQARNRERAAAAGLECPGYNRALSDFNEENPNSVSTFADVTGIWPGDTNRASEVYVQNRMNVDSKQEYIAYQIKKNKNRQQQSFDEIMSLISRKLIFHSGGYIAISNQLAEFYNTYKTSFRNRKLESSDVFKVSLDEVFPETGFVIGPYKQIISEILKAESVPDLIFNTPLTDKTKEYLKLIEVDISVLTIMIQKIMLVNAANYMGIVEDDVRNIFNIPGTGKYLVRNIVNQL
jgi:hypothetical protein